MALLNGGSAAPIDVDLLNISEWLDGPVLLGQSSTSFTVRPNATLEIGYVGTDFTFDANGNATSGTITGINVLLSGVSWLTLSNCRISVVTFRNFVGDSNTEDFLSAVLAGNDTIQGAVGTGIPDVFDGFAGNDRIEGGGGSDTLRGGAGNDTLSGGSSPNTLIGGAGNDTYIIDFGGDIADETGGSGVDTVIVGQAGVFDLSTNGLGAIENVVLSDAASSATGNNSNNKMTGNLADNTLSGGGGNDILDGGDGGDSLVGGAGADRMIGGNGNDTLSGIGLDRDVMIGGAGNDEYRIGDGDTVTEAPGGGIDLVRYDGAKGFTLGANLENLDLVLGATGTGNALDNKVTGNNGNNKLVGLAGNDTLDGGAGDDTLDGGVGGDRLIGGAGADTYIVDDKLDVVVDDALSFGIDTVRSSVSFDMSPGGQATGDIEVVILGGNAALNATGNAIGNTLIGNSGKNTLDGQDGDDRLDGGKGADTLIGGAGNDTYVIDSPADVIQENGADIADFVISTVSVDLTVAAFKNIEHVTLLGSKALKAAGNDDTNELTGNAGANDLFGGKGDDILLGFGGNDTLNGGLGDDIFNGGTGNDAYIVDSANDIVVGELAGRAGGTDTLFSTALDYTLAAKGNVENLVLLTGAVNGVGNELNNLVVGNVEANFLDGKDGNDTLNGGAGADFLLGGAGKDLLIGGTGDDEYNADEGDKIVESTAGASGGKDTIFYRGSTSYVLGANIENLELELLGSAPNATGNSLDNRIMGNAVANRLLGLAGNDTLDGIEGDNTLDGGLGVDSLVASNGSDTYIVDNALDVIDDIHGGNDTVHSSVSFDLNASATVIGDLENLFLTGSKAINGTGNALDNRITGNTGANVLDGGGGVDSLIGGAGNDKLSGGDVFADTLDGGAGADTMVGGSGDDRYVVDNAKDVVVETTIGIERDEVFASINYALGDNLEVLHLQGRAVSGTGNGLANSILGTGFANKLFGLDGDDELSGFAGNDTLDGGAGDDKMFGGVGNDTYLVNSDKDVVDEQIGGGIDTVVATVSYSLAPTEAGGVENLKFVGAANIDGVGNSLANLITGNEGNNLLRGADGNDTILGGAGADFLNGGAGNDKLDGGLGNDTIFGSEGDDTLTGGAGSDLFLYDTVNDGKDLIIGFDGNPVGTQDVLDLEALFDSLNTATVDRAGRVEITDRGAAVDVRVDADGNGSFELFVATLQTPDAISVGVDIVVGTL